jgi:DNA polymerase III subunit delta'
MTPHFDDLIGNATTKSYLKNILKKECIGNTILFAGPNGVGKSSFAHAFATEILCRDDEKGVLRTKISHHNHPDIMVYKPEGKIGMHSMASIRAFSKEVFSPPNEAPWKIFIIHDADRMLPTSANALLKTFEEPPPHSFIILVSSSPDKMLPTILSRCRKVWFRSLSDEEVIAALMQQDASLQADRAQHIAMLAQGSLEKAFSLLHHDDDEKRKLVLEILVNGSAWSYNEMSQAIQSLDKTMEKAKTTLKDSLLKEYEEIFEEATALQKEALNKEAEGHAAMLYLSEASAVFENTLSWYRDLSLIKHDGDVRLLFNKDYEKQLVEHSKKMSKAPNLMKVQEYISDASCAVQRSIKFGTCLEQLLLKLEVL